MSTTDPKPESRETREARASVLAEWRHIDLRSLEKGKQDRAIPLNLVMPKVLIRLGLERKRSEAEILKVWNNLLDPAITAHAQPTGLNKGTLFVTVDSSVWLDEIVRYRRREILERLKTAFGPDLIARISFRVG
ncbi:MAG: DUF721 domain-containing protein [Verrucomicrobiota bacterium]